MDSRSHAGMSDSYENRRMMGEGVDILAKLDEMSKTLKKVVNSGGSTRRMSASANLETFHKQFLTDVRSAEEFPEKSMVIERLEGLRKKIYDVNIEARKGELAIGELMSSIDMVKADMVKADFTEQSHIKFVQVVSQTEKDGRSRILLGECASIFCRLIEAYVFDREVQADMHTPITVMKGQAFHRNVDDWAKKQRWLDVDRHFFKENGGYRATSRIHSQLKNDRREQAHGIPHEFNMSFGELKSRACDIYREDEKFRNKVVGFLSTLNRFSTTGQPLSPDRTARDVINSART